MSSITWDETTPTAASLATDTDDIIRSDETAMATGIGQSFFWPGSAESEGDSAASGGDTRLGIARFHRGPSRFTTAENGFVSIDTGGDYGVSLRHIGTGTIESFQLGHCNVVEEVASKGVVDSRWLEQQGSDTFPEPSAIESNSIVFPTLYGSNTVSIRANLRQTGIGSAISFSFGVFSVLSSGFSSRHSYIGPGTLPLGGNLIVDWVSKGTVDT